MEGKKGVRQGLMEGSAALCASTVWKGRRRVNLSLDPASYDRLCRIQREYGFKNPCEMLAAMARILIGRLDPEGGRTPDLPEDDWRYIDGMFAELGDAEKRDGAVPARRKSRHIG